MKSSVYSFSKFTSIASFYNTIKLYRKRAGDIGNVLESMPSVAYSGTVKLHGTNAAVCVDATDGIFCQSRNNVLTGTQNDNAGWRTFADNTISGAVWRDIADTIADGADYQTVRIYGEWVGGSIQPNVALTGLPKHFVIFAATVNGTRVEVPSDLHYNEQQIYNIKQIPSYELSVDFSDLNGVSKTLNEYTNDVERECPWAKIMFGVSGIGEGLVWTPDDRINDTDLHFKTKGDVHAARQSPEKNVAPIDPEVVETINEVVDILLTENRMRQMITDNNISMDVKQTGQFLKAVCDDCFKEEVEVVTANGLEWKQVAKLLQSRARVWFHAEIEKTSLFGAEPT